MFAKKRLKRTLRHAENGVASVSLFYLLEAEKEVLGRACA